jgi:hypothetical protein
MIITKANFKIFLIYSIQSKYFSNLCKKEIKINDRLLISDD